MHINERIATLICNHLPSELHRRTPQAHVVGNGRDLEVWMVQELLASKRGMAVDARSSSRIGPRATMALHDVELIISLSTDTHRQW